MVINICYNFQVLVTSNMFVKVWQRELPSSKYVFEFDSSQVNFLKIEILMFYSFLKTYCFISRHLSIYLYLYLSI